MVGLRGGTARQSRPRGSVLGSAASRCVGFNPLPHSLTAFSLVRTFSFRLSLFSSDALQCVSSSLFISHLLLRSVFFSFLFLFFFLSFFRFSFSLLRFLAFFTSSFPTFSSSVSNPRIRAQISPAGSTACPSRVRFRVCYSQCAYTTTSRRGVSSVTCGSSVAA